MYRQGQEIRYGFHATPSQFMSDLALSDKDFSVNVQSTSQIIPVTTQAGYFWGRNQQSVPQFTGVHSRLFVSKLDMSYMLLHHNSWESATTPSGICQESTTYTSDHIYSHSGRIFWDRSMTHTADHRVHSPVAKSTFCTQHQSIWLGLFLSLVLCILFLTTVQCWCTIQLWWYYHGNPIKLTSDSSHAVFDVYQFSLGHPASVINIYNCFLCCFSIIFLHKCVVYVIFHVMHMNIPWW